VGLVVFHGDGRPPRALEAPAGSDAVAAIAALVRDANAEGLACEWVLEPSMYSLLQVEKPAVPEAEWLQALRWKARDLISFPIEDAVMDAFEVPGLESRGRPPTLYMAVARKDELRATIIGIESAGLRLSRIGIADLAWADAVRQLSPGDESQVALVLDARGGTMLVLREGALFVARRFEFDAADQRALREASSTERVFERIALELQRTLDYFDRTHQRAPPRRLLVWAGLDGLEGIGESLQTALGLEVQFAAPETQWACLADQAPKARIRLAGLAAVAAGGGQS
jgi:MSHA biogenesis protein MshI